MSFVSVPNYNPEGWKLTRDSAGVVIHTRWNVKMQTSDSDPHHKLLEKTPLCSTSVGVIISRLSIIWTQEKNRNLVGVLKIEHLEHFKCEWQRIFLIFERHLLNVSWVLWVCVHNDAPTPLTFYTISNIIMTFVEDLFLHFSKDVAADKYKCIFTFFFFFY